MEDKKIICSDCGIKYLTEEQKKEEKVVTFHFGICDECSNKAAVTSVRNYNYCKKEII
jgi:hypothetical protein